jgi:hypothetical protein
MVGVANDYDNYFRTAGDEHNDRAHAHGEGTGLRSSLGERHSGAPGREVCP